MVDGFAFTGGARPEVQEPNLRSLWRLQWGPAPQRILQPWYTLNHFNKSVSVGMATKLSSVSMISSKTGMKISPMDFANFWKMDGPTESCSDYTLESTESCDNLVRLHPVI